MLKDVLARVEQRLKAVGLKPATASRLAGLSEDAIRNMQRAVEKDASQGVSTNTIFALAPVLKTTPAWLLDGSGDEENRLVRIIGRAGADTGGELIHGDADENYDYVPAPPLGLADAAVQVMGDSMKAVADDGAILYFRDQRNPPTPDMIGYPCIVQLEDGRVLFKRLLRGSRKGLYMLESTVGPPIDNVRITWAAEPTAIIPAKEARRIIIKGGERQVA